MPDLASERDELSYAHLSPEHKADAVVKLCDSEEFGVAQPLDAVVTR